MKGAMSGARALVGKTLSVVCVLVLGCVLAGCGARPEPFERPSRWDSPTPTWTDEEQRAIDAVQRYLDLSTQIDQNIDTADWNRIYEVAGDPLAANDIAHWSAWSELGQHLVGAPTITVDWVSPGYLTSEGQQYYVHVCHDITGVYLFDAEGNRIEDRGSERAPGQVILLLTKNNQYLVVNERVEDGEC